MICQSLLFCWIPKQWVGQMGRSAEQGQDRTRTYGEVGLLFLFGFRVLSRGVSWMAGICPSYVAVLTSVFLLFWFP